MNLILTPPAPNCYTNRCQITRVTTEHWASQNLYCVACDCDTICRAPHNTKAVDFTCIECGHTYQLKSAGRWSETKIVDAGYQSMAAAIKSQRRPSLFVLNYTPDWQVRNLLLIPKFFFTESVIEQRKPLSSNARRAGWIGCNILLHRIPTDGKLVIVSDGVEAARNSIRELFKEVQPLEELSPSLRGWTLDVLRIARKLGSTHFKLNDVYRFESELREIHPDNRNIRAKIRQQLQVLRDLGFVAFSGRGNYEMIR